MERLTKRLNDGKVLCIGVCEKECVEGYYECHKCKPFEDVVKKLADYEDAEDKGLLFGLPCKVGDAVYHESQYATVHKGVQAYQITNIMISQNKKGEWTKKYRAMMLLNGRIVDSQLNFSFDDLGKTVFLTKEEAEKALKQMGE